MKRGNIVFGLIAIAIAAFTFNQLGEFPEAMPGEIGANFFPMILAYGLGLTGVILIVSSFFHNIAEEAEPFNIKERSTQRAIVALIATIFYCLSLDWLGFIACTFCFLIFMMFLMKQRALLKIIVISGAITTSVFVVFNQFLNILLPMGTLYGY